jgi:hypothetical protein
MLAQAFSARTTFEGDPTASSLADLSESVPGQESADLLAREGPRPTQPLPQDA